MSVLQDQAARRSVLDDLESNFLVEAGAGSGKTEALTQRMLRLIAKHGGDLSKVVAITFTRKAASEMRQRVQEGLETAVLKGRWGYRSTAGQLPEEEVPAALKQALETALKGLERLQITTIHAFCGQLLMSVPLPVGLHPGFRTLEEEQGDGLLKQGFLRWLEEHTEAQETLEKIGTHPKAAADLFLEYAARKDVDLTDVTVVPGELDLAGAVRGLKELQALALSSLGDLKEGMGDEFHEDLQRTLGWPAEPRADLLAHALDDLVAGLIKDNGKGLTSKPASMGIKVTKYTDKIKAEALFKSAQAVVETQDLIGFLMRWREWRHAHLLAVFKRALDAGHAARLRQGLLTFGDLLRCTLKALDDEGALRRLRTEIECVLVDEFQDTDPLQLKLAVTLAGQGVERIEDWRRATLRPGSLFLVGDPKQSIYRFRRADIGLYLQVRQAAEKGDTGLKLLTLNTNFRSEASLLQGVNAHFGACMQPTEWQAQYQAMASGRQAGAKESGIYLLEPLPQLADSRKVQPLIEADAARVAAHVKQLIASGQTTPGEILILTWGTKRMGVYAQALEAAGIHAQVSGSKDLGERVEMADLARALWSLAWPRDQAALVGVLRGLLFGLGDDQLAEWAQRERPQGAARWRAPDVDDPGGAHSVGKALRQWEYLCRSIQGLPATAVAEKLILAEGLALQAARSSGERELRLGALWKQVEAWKAREAKGERLRLVTLAQEARDLALHADDQAEDKAEGSVARPGAPQAVRLMNLHKAKGLEAEVVFLVEPALNHLSYKRSPSDLVLRDEGGGRLYFAPLNLFGNGYGDYLPPDWDQVRLQAELALEAERLRLLYVAATRAKRQLVISQAQPLMTSEGEVSSAWVYPWETLKGIGSPYTGIPAPLSPPQSLSMPAASELLAKAVSGLEMAQRSWSKSSWVHQTPSRLKGAPARALTVQNVPIPAGARVAAAAVRDFGDAFHTLLEMAVRSSVQPPNETRAKAWAEGLAQEFDLPEGASKALLLRLGAVMAAPFWTRLAKAKTRLIEYPLLELSGEGTVYTEAKLDLAFEEEDGWVVADWKSGQAARQDPDAYAPQLSEYARLLELGLNTKVKECLLVLV